MRFIIALPMLQLFLFGNAINTDPKNLPAGLLSVEHSQYERALAAALRNSGYYDISVPSSEAESERGLAQGKLLFVINNPPRFDRSVMRRRRSLSTALDREAADVDDREPPTLSYIRTCARLPSRFVPTIAGWPLREGDALGLGMGTPNGSPTPRNTLSADASSTRRQALWAA